MHKTRTTAFWAACALLPALLAGCGGGSGDSSSPYAGTYAGTFTAADVQGRQSGTISALIERTPGLRQLDSLGRIQNA